MSMKKIKSLFMALAALMLSVPCLHAQNYIIGAPVPLDDELDGMEVVFEGYSDDSNLGGYLGELKPQSQNDGVVPTLTRFTGEIPEKIVWVIEELDSVCTLSDIALNGQKLYNLKNKATNEYIGTDWSRDGGNSQNCIFMVPTKEEAAAFQFHYSNDGGSYGSVGYGSFDGVSWNTNGSAMTIVDVYPKVSITNNRGFVCNEANENVKGFHSWQDTNIWIMHRYWAPSTGKDFLNEFLNDLPYGWQDTYKVGTDPGYVADAEKFQQFYDLWMKANNEIGNMSDDEAMDIYKQLTELYTWLQSSESQVQFEDGGYYYFFTANNAFVEMENGNYAMYAPKQDEPNILGWKEFDEKDPRFIWQIKMADVAEDGTVHYSVQNMGSGVYIGQSASKADGQPIQWTAEYTYPTLFVPQNHAGHWWITDQRDWNEYPPRPFHQENHADGAGTAGKIVLWSGGIGTASDWFIKPVPQDMVDMITSMQSRIELTNYWAQNGNLASGIDTAMNKPGYISSMEILNNYKQAAADIDTMLNYPEKAYNEEEYAAALESFKAVAEAYKADRDRGLEDGYYRIQLGHWFAYKNDTNYYMQIVDDRPGWARTPEATLSQIWKIERIEGNKYSMQNMGNGKYMGRGDSNSYWSLMNFSDAEAVPQFIRPFEAMNGQFYFTNGVDSTYNYDDGDHNEGTNSSAVLRYYDGRAVQGGTAWEMLPVSEAELAIIQANDAQVTLRYELESTLKKAQRLYNNNTTYTYGEKIVSDATQIYSNNNSVNEGKDLNALIDDNIDTWWNSSWDTEQNPAETHYLRFETTASEGLPDSVMVRSIQRNNSSWHRTPSKLRVSMSNDGETWTYLPSILEKADINKRDFSAFSTDPMFTLVSGIGGYKYVRFEFLATQPHYEFNGHPIGEFSEINLFPVTGIDADNSLTETPSYKVVSAELFNAIQKGHSEFAANAPTQATIDLLKAAIENFGNVSVADSAIAMANLNMQNLSSGDLIGEFPNDALQTYTTEAGAAIDKYEAAGENRPGEVITTVVNELKAAYDKLYPQMVKPVEGKWYVLNSMNPDVSNWTLAAGGNNGHTGSSYSYMLSTASNAGSGSLDTDVRSHFTFKENEDGTWTIQCAGTGFYFGPETGSGNSKYDHVLIQWYEPATTVELIPFGEGEIGFRTANGKYLTGATALGTEGVPGSGIGVSFETHDGTQGLGSKYSWLPEATLDDNGIDGVATTTETEIEEGRVIAMTKPYTMDGMPLTDAGALEGYKVVGQITADNSADSLVIAYQLQKLDETMEIPAGMPVVYVAPGDEYTPESYLAVTYNAVVDGEVTSEADTINGLAGNIGDYNTSVAHLGYFLEDSVVDEPANTTIGYHRAVLVPWLVENLMESDPNVSVDLVVYVKGNGMLNDINEVVVEDPKELVDVYSIDGVLLRRNVARANATNGLAKGIYIVGKQKVLVK